MKRKPRFNVNYAKRLKGYPSLAGKTAAVSGSTGGLGVWLVRYLAFLGAGIILLDRNREKAAALADGVRAEFPGADIKYIPLDLSCERSAEDCAAVLEDNPPDLLFLNAGAYAIPRRICKCGYNNVFLINFVSPFYLVTRLMPALSRRGGRVVAVGSIAHRYSHTDQTDVDFSTRRSPALCYGNAKRYLMFSLYGLFKKQSGATLAVTHPGITFTNITAHYPKWLFAIIKYPMKIIFMNPGRAALCILRGAFDECGWGEWIGPRFFGIWGGPKKKRLSVGTDEAERVSRTADEVMKKYTESLKEKTDAVL